MIKKIIATSLICMLFLAGIIAQNRDIASVASAIDKLRLAMIDADSSTLVSLVADDLSYGHSHGNVENKAAFITAIVSGKSNFETMDLSEQTISISGDVATVRHQLSAKIIDSGKPGEVHLQVLMIWQKQKGKWKLLARQAVKAT